jgi:hypothetical protein
VGTSGAVPHNEVSLVTLTAEFPMAPEDTARRQDLPPPPGGFRHN